MDRWAVRAGAETGGALRGNRVGGRRRRRPPARRRLDVDRPHLCVAIRSLAALPGVLARPAPQRRSMPAADRSPSEPNIPAPLPCGYSRRIAPADGNDAANSERRAGSEPPVPPPCGCRPAGASGRRTPTALRTTRIRRAPDPAVLSGRRGWSPARCSGCRHRRIWRRSVPLPRRDRRPRCWVRCRPPLTPMEIRRRRRRRVWRR